MDKLSFFSKTLIADVFKVCSLISDTGQFGTLIWPTVHDVVDL